MVAGKIRHWKHGWIPVSDAAKAYKAGVGPKPGSGTPASTSSRRFNLTAQGKSPNNKFGLPTRGVHTDKAGGERRAKAISELVPGIGKVSPFYRGESQDMPGHWTGGVRTSRSQTETLVKHVEKYGGRRNEGEANAEADMRQSGIPIPDSKASQRIQADDYAKRLAAVIPALKPGTKAGMPGPYYSQDGKLPNGSYYDGGLVFSDLQADALIDWLGDSVHGGDDRHK
jgi:hypothetical protein